jgi:hypothetical protein
MSNNNLAISKLKQITGAKKVPAYAPSLGTIVELHPLSVKQQKELLKTALDIVMTPITFALATSDIITKNLSVPAKLTILDKPGLLLALRADALGTEVTQEVEGIKVKFDYADNLKAKNKIDLTAFTTSILLDKIEVVTKVPTLDEDFRTNAECKRILDNKKSTNEDKLRELVGEVYIYELIKFIDCIKLADGASIDEIKFSTLTIPQQIEVIESLPMALNGKLIEFISTVRDAEQAALKVKTDDTTYTINLDTVFFTKE